MLIHVQDSSPVTNPFEYTISYAQNMVQITSLEWYDDIKKTLIVNRIINV